MKLHHFAIALLAFALTTPALATGNHECPYGGKWPDCKDKPEPPQPQDPSQQQDQQQGQGQSQGQIATGGDSSATGGNGYGGTGIGTGGAGGAGGAGGDGGAGTGVGIGLGQGGSVDGSGNSRNTNTANGGSADSTSVSGATGGSVGDTSSGSIAGASVGDTDATGGSVGDTASFSGGNTMVGGDNAASADGSGNADVTIDSSNRSSYSAQALYLPTIETAAPALVANPSLVVDRGACGPRMDKRSERVQGTYVGIFKRSSLDLGVDDELIPASEPYRFWNDPAGARHVFGHQVVTFASVNGVAASRSIGLGGGKTGGDWGQAGASSGSSVQRTVLRIQLQECELPMTERIVQVEVPAKDGKR